MDRDAFVVQGASSPVSSRFSDAACCVPSKNVSHDRKSAVNIEYRRFVNARVARTRLYTLALQRARCNLSHKGPFFVSDGAPVPEDAVEHEVREIFSRNNKKEGVPLMGMPIRVCVCSRPPCHDTIRILEA